MTPQELRDRTKSFAVNVVRTVEPLLGKIATRDAALQLTRSASSVAANYRAACVARSHAEFRAKIGGALEECDESVYWLELLGETARPWEKMLSSPAAEGRELTKILGASKRTSHARARRLRPSARPRPPNNQ